MPKILTQPGAFEFEEKRSRFLGYCAPAPTEAAARLIISEVRTAHPKANHNVYAYATREGNVTRFSDDGEPGGTAGMPILNLFQKSGVVDFVCVVTRYFGGTLLGTGGLVRAYTKTAKGALEAANAQDEIIKTAYSIICEYNKYDQVKYNFDKWGIVILSTEYTDKCRLCVEVTAEQEPLFHDCRLYTII